VAVFYLTTRSSPSRSYTITVDATRDLRTNRHLDLVEKPYSMALLRPSERGRTV
jgi:hypothetical protein